MEPQQDGAKRSTVTVKTLKTVLKRAGLKTTGKKATLTRRAKKAKLMGGQISTAVEEAGKTAESAVRTTKALFQTPLAAAKAALDGEKKGGRHRGRKH